MTECALCHPFDPRLSADPRTVYPCGFCLLAMPTGMRKRWSKAWAERLVSPRVYGEAVIEILQWARERVVR